MSDQSEDEIPELLYKHLHNCCGAKEIIEIAKNVFFEGVINGEKNHTNLKFNSNKPTKADFSAGNRRENIALVF